MVPSYSAAYWYWTPTGGRKDLNQLVVNLPGGVTLNNVSAISPRGLITGFDSRGHPYLLTPLTGSTSVELLLLD